MIIPEGIKENIFKYRFADFLRSHNKPFSGKASIWERLEQALEGDDELTSHFEQFIVDEISNGKARQIFICSFSIESVAILSNYRSLQSNLAANGLPFENFNRLLTEGSNDGDMVYLNIHRDSDNQNKVDQISMAFIKESVVEVQEVDGEPSEKNITNYVWIDIYPSRRYLQVKVRPYSNNYITNMEKSTKVFDYYWAFLAETFEIVYENMSDTKNTLYRIFKVLTEKAEAPYKSKIDETMPLLAEKVAELAQAFELPNPRDPVDLQNRVARLFERALILSDLENYKAYGGGKLGIVERIDFSDQSGARVNALSGTEGIDVADIFFDTRETLDELGQLNKLWVTWFLPNTVTSGDDEEDATEEPDTVQEAEIERVETRIEVFPNKVVIHFLNLLTVPKEVQDYVLSVFRKFEEGEIPGAVN